MPQTSQASTVATGISLPADIMAMLDNQASARRLKRSQYIAQLVLDQHAKLQKKTRQSVGA